MHISSLLFDNVMMCPKCRGRMVRENWFDLPKDYYELYCINCGNRIWFNQKTIEKPIYSN